MGEARDGKGGERRAESHGVPASAGNASATSSARGVLPRILPANAAPPEGGTPCGTLAVERASSPPGAEGWVEGEDGGVLAGAGALEPSGFSPSPRPGSAGRGGALAAGWAKVAFTLSAGAETTALAGTVTAMVGAWILTSSRGMKTVTPESAMFGGSLAGRSGALEAAWVEVSSLGLAFSDAEECDEGVFPVVSCALETISGVTKGVSGVVEAISAAEDALTTAEDASLAPEDASLAPEGAKFPAADASPTVEEAFPTAADAMLAAEDGWLGSEADSVAAEGGLDAAVVGWAAGSDGWGAAPWPSAGLSALDLRNQSSMTSKGGEGSCPRITRINANGTMKPAVLGFHSRRFA